MTTEILCAIPEDAFAAFAQAARAAGVAIASIGTIIAGAVIPAFLDAQGRGTGAETKVVQPFLGIWRKASYWAQIPAESAVFAGRGVAPGV